METLIAKLIIQLVEDVPAVFETIKIGTGSTSSKDLDITLELSGFTGMISLPESLLRGGKKT